MASQSFVPALVVALALCGCARDRSSAVVDAGGGAKEPGQASAEDRVPQADTDAGGAPPPREPPPAISSAPFDDDERDDDAASTAFGSGLDDRPEEDDASAARPQGAREPESILSGAHTAGGWLPLPFPLPSLPTWSVGFPGSSSPLEQELGVTGPFAGRTTIALHDVELTLPDDVLVGVEDLTGVLQAAPTGIIDLDTPAALELHVREAVVSLDERAVARLLALALEESPFESASWLEDDDAARWDDVTARFVDGQLTLSADLPRAGRIDIGGYFEATMQGALRLVVLRMEREGRRADSLRDLFEEDGLEVPLRLSQRRAGVSAALFIDDEGLTFDVNALCTAPQLYARVVDVSITDERLRLLLEGAAPAVRLLAPPGSPGGYLWLRGGPLRFGRLLMERSDVLFVPLGPEERLSLSLEDYQRQLQRGQALWRADLGLTLQVPAMEAQSELDEALLP